MQSLDRPDWRDERVGSRIRVAAWLLTEVGVGSTFTKAMLREAFPRIEQIDKRMRELRPSGWRIDTARQDPSLKLNELRFVEMGSPVWNPSKESTLRLTARERKIVLERDGYACVTCGISAGVPYHNEPLRRAYVAPKLVGTATHGIDAHVTECDMCRAASRGSPVSTDLVERAVRLGPKERQCLIALLSLSCRSRSAVEQIWPELRRTAPEQRDLVLRAISDSHGAKSSVE